MGKAMRLDKLLGHTGWGTRKELKDLCKSGQVTINGDICRDSSRKVDPDQDVVAVGSQIVSYEEYIYLMLYKPSGVVSATEDNVSQTVIDLLPQKYQGSRLFPVGRLDKDTTGLLFLTNDGTWAHGITSPKSISLSAMKPSLKAISPPISGSASPPVSSCLTVSNACRQRPNRRATIRLPSSSKKESSTRSSACVPPSDLR